MSDFSVGDVITFRLHEELYGLGRIIFIESLSQFDRIHLQVYDAVLDAGPGSIDSSGESCERTHDLSGLEDPRIVIDHLCVDLAAFNASEPMIVDYRDVEDDDMAGYHLWLAVQHDQMVRLGMISPTKPVDGEGGDHDDVYDGGDQGDDDDAPHEDGHHGDGDDDVNREDDTDIIEDKKDGAGTSEGFAGGDEGHAAGEEAHGGAPVLVRPWHQIVLREPIGDALVNLHAAFADEELRATTLGAYLTGIYSSENVGTIRKLLDDLLAGDFGAGQELMEFGEGAVASLGEQLDSGNLDAQQTEDLLNILTDIATLSAYELIATQVERHIDHLDSDIGHAVARAYCYAVMLTGGGPEPLQRVLPALDKIDHPDLRADVANARNAVANAGPPDVIVADPRTQGGSSSPFGTLDV